MSGFLSDSNQPRPPYMSIFSKAVFTTKHLEIISLLYVALPWLIFSWGWLTTLAAVISTLFLVSGFVSASRAIDKDKLLEGKLSRTTMLTIAATALLWCLLSGVAGFGRQTWDWIKHNAMLKDLIGYPWPVTYTPGGVETHLVYNFAYYLPAALIGKLCGWNIANCALFLFTVLGVFLSLLWFTKLVDSPRRPVFLLFVFYSGMTFVGHFILTHHWYKPFEIIDNWIGPNLWQYQSNEGLMIFVPQHFLPGWIITAMIAHRALFAKSAANVFLYWALSILWSPFIGFGLIPFMAASLYQTRCRGLLSLANLLCAPFMVALAYTFYLAHSFNIPGGWVTESLKGKELIVKLLLFYVMEFGLYALLCWTRKDPLRPELKIWWWTTLLTLMVCPLYKFGFYNDFTMRTAIPALFLFWVLVTRSLIYHEKAVQFYCLIACLGTGALAPLWMFLFFSLSQYHLNIPNEKTVVHVYQLEDYYVQQYLGNLKQGPIARFIKAPGNNGAAFSESSSGHTTNER